MSVATVQLGNLYNTNPSTKPVMDGLRASDRPKAVRAVTQEFEAFVLQSFVEALLPDEASAFFGTGTAGAFWKSMLAEHVARELARGGSVGIGNLIEKELAERSGGYV